MTPGEYEHILHDTEVRLARVKGLYEQYFQGIERLEPTVARKELDRAMEVLRKNQPRNTALRFRTQMLVAKYGTYQSYWQRIARQIEEGTFRRDVVKVQQKRQRDQARAKGAPELEKDGPSAWELDVDVELEPMETSSLGFDESDVDAILGSFGPKTDPAPAPRRALSPFGAPSSVPGPRTSPLPPPGNAGPSTATFGKPATATFGKPATATFGKPATASFGKPGTASFAKPSMGETPAAKEPPAASVTAAIPPKPAPPAVPRPPIPPPARPAPPPPPARPVPIAAPVAAPIAAPPPRAPQADDAHMRRLYDNYVEAKKKNNERVDNVKYESLATSVQQMMPKLREKHGNRPIDFEIVVQNGKVGLKPKVGG